MVAMPQPTHSTVRRIYELHEQRRETKPRPYLGASVLGESCVRRLWYSWRWCGGEEFEGRMLRLFGTGDIAETRLLDELRAIGVQVEGSQHEVVFADGHGGGHLDGAVLGLEEAPKTWHVFECKTHNAKSYKDLLAKGVKESKPKHWAQMIVYMGLTGMDRAAYFAVNKDTDEITLERVHFDQAEFDKLIAKAKAIIDAAEPPMRINEDPTWWECRFCPFKAQCHGAAVPAVTCRSCAHSTPIADGAWSCDRFASEIPEDAQLAACDDHLFIPALLERVAELVEANDDRVRWRNKLTGKTFDQPGYTSRELAAAKDFRVIGDDFVQEIKAVFGADSKVVSSRPLDEPGDAPKSDLDAIYGKDGNEPNPADKLPRRAARRTAKA